VDVGDQEGDGGIVDEEGRDANAEVQPSRHHHQI